MLITCLINIGCVIIIFYNYHCMIFIWFFTYFTFVTYYLIIHLDTSSLTREFFSSIISKSFKNDKYSRLSIVLSNMRSFKKQITSSFDLIPILKSSIRILNDSADNDIKLGY